MPNLLDEIEGIQPEVEIPTVEVEEVEQVVEQSEEKAQRKPTKRILEESEVKADKYKEYLAKVEEAKAFASKLGVDYLGILASSVNPKFRAASKRAYSPKEKSLTENEQLFETFKDELDSKMDEVLNWATEELKALATAVGFSGQIPEPTRTLYLAKSEEFKEFLKK